MMLVFLRLTKKQNFARIWVLILIASSANKYIVYASQLTQLTIYMHICAQNNLSIIEPKNTDILQIYRYIIAISLKRTLERCCLHINSNMQTVLRVGLVAECG